MMHQFLSAHRTELIERCRKKVALRAAPEATQEELLFGVPLFLDQVIKTLRVEQTTNPMESRKVSGQAGGGNLSPSEIGDSAAEHGRELLQRGFTVDQVIHDYGDLCQAITDLAFEKAAPIAIDEFRTLNSCLDNAIADAVTEFTYQRDVAVADVHADELNERLGYFAHELRNLLSKATLALSAIKAGNVGLSGPTGGVLDASLVGLRNLVDRTLTEMHMAAGLPVQPRLFSLADFVGEINLAGSLAAELEGCRFTVRPVDRRLAVEADRDLLSSAVGNLLQNAFKFSQAHSEVALTAYSAADRIRIEVEDHCGGLPVADAEALFKPSVRKGADKTAAVGVGLSIARRSVEANRGTLSVRDLPGSGCVFTIDLPRHAMSDGPSAN